MHELSYVAALIDLLERSAGEQGLRRVTRVDLVVGELAGVLPEALEFAFATLAPTRGPLLAEAKLAIERRPALARCAGCGQAFAVAVHGLRCPSWGDGEAHIFQGDEFLLAAYEGER